MKPHISIREGVWVMVGEYRDGSYMHVAMAEEFRNVAKFFRAIYINECR